MGQINIKKEWIDTAIIAAKQSSEAILKIYKKDFEVIYKQDSSPVTEADKKSSKIILAELEKTNIPIISEEEENLPFSERKKHALIWVVDPLDGTKEFVNKNDEFCICIALIHKQKPIFGLIASPITGKILLGGPTIGAYYFNFSETFTLNEKNKIPPLKINSKKTIAYSRSHFSKDAQKFIETITTKYGTPEFIKKGSALKFIDLALGKADFYPRMAPTMEWDIAAGQAIYESVGGEVLDFSNFEPLYYNKESLYNPYFIAKNKDLTI